MMMRRGNCSSSTISSTCLSNVLLKRSIQNPEQVGNLFFWYLFGEYNDLKYCERFRLLLKEYLSHSVNHAKQLFVQNVFLKKLNLYYRNCNVR